MQGLVSGKPGRRPHCIEQITRDWDCVSSLLVSDPVTQGRDLCPMKTAPATTVVLSHSTVPSAGSEPRLPWFTQLPHVTLASYLAPFCLSFFNCKMEFL